VDNYNSYLQPGPGRPGPLVLPWRRGKLSIMSSTWAKLVTAILAVWLLAWPAAPEAAEPAGEAAASVSAAQASVPESPGAEPPAEEITATPAQLCFQAARDGGRDAYACDLAVQVARDAGNRNALVAALVNRSLILRRDNRLEPALEDLNAALGQAPEDAALHSSLGNLLLRLGRASEALAAHNQAVELAPDDPGTWYNRAFSHRALGDTVRAGEDVAASRARLNSMPVDRSDSRAARY
jgi:tetratricopeptide (TPR) repeat protein